MATAIILHFQFDTASFLERSFPLIARFSIIMPNCAMEDRGPDALMVQRPASESLYGVLSL